MKQGIIITNLLLISGLVLSGCVTSPTITKWCEGSKNPSCATQMTKARIACNMLAYSPSMERKATGRVICNSSGTLSNGEINGSGQVTGNVYSQAVCQPEYKSIMNEATYQKAFSACMSPKAARIRAGVSK